MDNQERLVYLCGNAFKSKNLDDKHLGRLKAELKEIKESEMHDYFIDLHDR